MKNKITEYKEQADSYPQVSAYLELINNKAPEKLEAITVIVEHFKSEHKTDEEITKLLLKAYSISVL